MKHRILAATVALSLSMLSLPTLHAAESPQGKVKMSSVHMRNTTAAPVTVQAGDRQITLAPGKEGTLKVPSGAQLTSVGQTPNHTAGSVIATAGTLGGNTLLID